MSLRVLIGCEESGIVRDAFRKRGYDAISCDLIPSRRLSPHLQMDIMEAIKCHGPWGEIILFPDCTAMALSGNRWYGQGMKWNANRIAAVEWTSQLWELAKKHCLVGCAIENPASVLWSEIGRPQYIQPYMFGHGEQKKTGILTYGLPRLIPTMNVEGREQRIWKMAPSPTRKRDRSETFQGVAGAMAEQYGQLLDGTERSSI